MNNEKYQLQKLAGLLKESINEAGSKSGTEKLEAILINLSRNISTDSNIPTASKQGLLDAFNEMSDIVNDMLDAEEVDPFYDAEEDHGPVTDYSKRRASELNEQDHPEGDKLVLDFLTGIANEYDYPVSQAVMFVQDRIKNLQKLGAINEIDRNDPILMKTRANAYQKSLPKPKPTKIKTPMVVKNAAKIKDLLAQLKTLRANQDAEARQKGLEGTDDGTEAGQKGPKWTDDDANRYGGQMNDIEDQIKKLSGQSEWGPETNPYMDKAEIERRAARIMRLP